MQNNKTVAIVEKLATEIAAQLNYEIWDVRFEKEGPSWYLRIFIDNESGITIEDCEQMSRAIDKPLDELDPISVPYCLEVCSPGLERELVKERHFKKFIGEKIKIRLIRPLNGAKEIKGTLVDFHNNIITLKNLNDEFVKISIKDTAFIKLDIFD